MLLNRVFQDPSTGKRYRVVLEHLSDLMLIDVDSDKAWQIGRASCRERVFDGV